MSLVADRPNWIHVCYRPIAALTGSRKRSHGGRVKANLGSSLPADFRSIVRGMLLNAACTRACARRLGSSRRQRQFTILDQLVPQPRDECLHGFVSSNRVPHGDEEGADANPMRKFTSPD